MLIVADTSPLISLLVVKQFRVLEILHPDFLIPPIVFNELTQHLKAGSFSSETESIRKHIRKPVKNFDFGNTDNLDAGEKECISLFKELNADLLLIDDYEGRLFSESIGIKCIGTLGLLLRAKEKNLISELKPIFEQFKLHKRFFSKDILDRVLKNTGEI